MTNSGQAGTPDAGANEVIDRTTTNAWEEVATLAPDGIDVMLDVVAGDGIPTGLASMREGGRWVVAGALGGYAIDLDVRRLYLHNIALVGSSMHTPAHFAALVAIANQGLLRPVVAATYSLADVHQAQADLAARQHVGNLVLTNN